MFWQAAATAAHRHLLILLPDCPSNPWWWVTVQPCKPGDSTWRAGEISYLFLIPPEICDWLSTKSAGFLHGCIVCSHEGQCWHREKNRGSMLLGWTASQKLGAIKAVPSSYKGSRPMGIKSQHRFESIFILFWENKLKKTTFSHYFSGFLVSLPFPFSSSLTPIW